jgi:hypothetical protein
MARSSCRALARLREALTIAARTWRVSDVGGVPDAASLALGSCYGFALYLRDTWAFKATRHPTAGSREHD